MDYLRQFLVHVIIGFVTLYRHRPSRFHIPPQPSRAHQGIMHHASCIMVVNKSKSNYRFF